MASAKKNLKSNGSSTRPRKRPSAFAVCVKNVDYPASLELRKIYRLLPDPPASVEGLVRVVDESGDDYLYPKDYFIAIELPKLLKKAVEMVS